MVDLPDELFCMICSCLSLKTKFNTLVLLNNKCRDRFRQNRTLCCLHDHVVIDRSISAQVQLTLLDYIDSAKVLEVRINDWMDWNHNYDCPDYKDHLETFLHRLWSKFTSRSFVNLQTFTYEGPINVMLHDVIIPVRDVASYDYDHDANITVYSFSNWLPALSKARSLTILPHPSCDISGVQTVKRGIVWTTRDRKFTWHEHKLNPAINWLPLQQFSALTIFALGKGITEGNCDDSEHIVTELASTIDSLTACLPPTITALFVKNLDVWEHDHHLTRHMMYRKWREALLSPLFLPHLTILDLNLGWYNDLEDGAFGYEWTNESLGLARPLCTMMETTGCVRPIHTLSASAGRFDDLIGLTGITKLALWLVDCSQNPFVGLSLLCDGLLPSLTYLDLHLVDCDNVHFQHINEGYFDIEPVLHFLMTRRIRSLKIKGSFDTPFVLSSDVIASLRQFIHLETLVFRVSWLEDDGSWLATLPVGCWPNMTRLSCDVVITTSSFEGIAGAAPNLKVFKCRKMVDPLAVLFCVSRYPQLEVLKEKDYDDDCPNYTLDQARSLYTSSFAACAIQHVQVFCDQLTVKAFHFISSKLREAPRMRELCLEPPNSDTNRMTPEIAAYLCSRFPNVCSEIQAVKWAVLSSEEQQSVSAWDAGDYSYPYKRPPRRRGRSPMPKPKQSNY